MTGAGRQKIVSGILMVFSVLAFAVALQAAPPTVSLEDVILLAQSGISDETILVFLDYRDIDFDLSPEEILRLREAGVSEEIIRYLLERTEVQLEGVPVPRSYYYPPRYYAPLTTAPERATTSGRRFCPTDGGTTFTTSTLAVSTWEQVTMARLGTAMAPCPTAQSTGLADIASATWQGGMLGVRLFVTAVTSTPPAAGSGVATLREWDTTPGATSPLVTESTATRAPGIPRGATPVGGLVTEAGAAGMAVGATAAGMGGTVADTEARLLLPFS